MQTEIIVALIAASGSFLGSLMTNNKTLYRIDQLEEKQDKHNQLIERVYKLEQKVEDMTYGK